MTDKRYFALIGEDGYVYPVFFDSENEDKEIDVDIVVDLLNENEQLKFQLDECRNHKLFSRRELEKENEQLKQRNKRLEEKIQRERRVSAKQHLKWNKEAENKIKELSDENEHYKSIFFELVETALTDKNCRELYCKGILDIFNKANSLNQARDMIKEFLE